MPERIKLIGMGNNTTVVASGEERWFSVVVSDSEADGSGSCTQIVSAKDRIQAQNKALLGYLEDNNITDHEGNDPLGYYDDEIAIVSVVDCGQNRPTLVK